MNKWKKALICVWSVLTLHIKKYQNNKSCLHKILLNNFLPKWPRFFLTSTFCKQAYKRLFILNHHDENREVMGSENINTSSVMIYTSLSINPYADFKTTFAYLMLKINASKCEIRFTSSLSSVNELGPYFKDY